MLFQASGVWAQVNVTATAGTANASYTTLKNAFDAINAGTHQGSIGIGITGNTTETASAVLNASGSGAAGFTSVQINPSGGASRSITGTIAGALIEFNGADNVSINGLNSGGNALVISNLDSGISASTLQLINDASSNTITNVTLLGAGTNQNQGTLVLAGGNITGNDNNFISNCTIDAAGAAFPTNGVLSFGNASPAENSGNTIENCNVANFFNAGIVSTGILIGFGSSNWTLSGNRFYQSATRTFTTASTHRAIQISAGDNHSVTGNRIGFANAAGTGIYTMAGAVATRFIGLDLGVGTTVASSVQGNTVSGISLATSSGAATQNGVLCGINITSGNVNVGTVTPNVIGGIAGADLLNAVSTTPGALIVGIHSASTGTLVLQNNVIGGLSSSGTTASISGSLTGINVSGAASSMTISGNTIGNATADNMRGGTSGLTTANSLVSGINFSNTATASYQVSNNTIQNLVSYGTGTTGFVRGIWTAATTSPQASMLFSSNTITNLSSNNTNSSISNGQAGALGINIAMGNSIMVSDNVISNIARTNTGTGGGWTAGITYGNATNSTIIRNRIFNLSNASTSNSANTPGIAAGIVIRSGTTEITVANNMIALGSGQTTNTAFIGIQANHGSTPDPIDRIYFNTIHITGTAASGGISSFGFLRGDFSTTARNQTIDLRNNLISNTRSGGTGGHFAIANQFGATASATGWPSNASNFNVLNANAATIGHWNGNQTFSGWKIASLSDELSFSNIGVTFVNPSSDLHLNMGTTPTNLESGGAAIAGISNDFDQQTRPGPTGSVNGGAQAPDIGADEFDGVYLDSLAPAIDYAALLPTSLTSDRVLVVTINDFSGVPTVGALVPRVYYRKNAGAYASQACVLSSGSGTTGVWNCTILHASVGGVAFGDVVHYFVVAQDTLGNLRANPSGGFVGTNVNSFTTPPTAPNQYLIGTGFSGVINVGNGETYTSLTNAGGIFEAINNGALVGDTTINITSDLTAETGAVALNQWVEKGGPFTLLIRPSAAPRTISGSINGALIRINGADRVTIDGSTTGATASNVVGGDAGLRELTIQNTNVGPSSGVINVGSGTNGAQNNTLRNLIVLGQDPTTTLVGIAMGGNTPGTAGTDNDNNRVENCAIRRANFGLYSAGQSAANPNTGTVLTMNDVSGLGPDRVRRAGMVVFNDSGAQVTLNNVGNIDTNESADAVGIGIGVQGFDATSTTSGGVTNALVSRNRINGVNSQSTSGFSAAGIAVAGAPGVANTVVNNMISGVTAPATTPDLVAGIYVAGVTGSSTRVLYNSIAMTGDRGAVATQMPSFGMAITGVDPTVELKNNSFSNTQIASGGGVNAKSYAIGMATTTFANLDSNFNNFFASGANAGFFRSGGLGAGSGTDHANLAAWATVVSDDANSLELDPLYASSTDLHLLHNSPLARSGTPIIGVLVDIDNDQRLPSTPSMGADEVVYDADLQVSKSNDVTALLNGQSTVYAIVVANAGPDPSQSMNVSDSLPSNLINGTWTCVQAQSTATCPTPDAGVGSLFTTISLNSGEHIRFDVMATVNGSVGAFVSNTAVVSAPLGVFDANLGNNTATDMDPIVGIGIFADGFENSARANLTLPSAQKAMHD